MKISDATKNMLKDTLLLLEVSEENFAEIAEGATNTDYFIDSVLDDLQERGYVSFVRSSKQVEKYLTMHKEEQRLFSIDVGGGAYFMGKVAPAAADKFVEKLREYFAASGDDEYKVNLI